MTWRRKSANLSQLESHQRDGGAAGLPSCHRFATAFYPSDDLPIDVDFNGDTNQLNALAETDIMSSQLTYVIFQALWLDHGCGCSVRVYCRTRRQDDCDGKLHRTDGRRKFVCGGSFTHKLAL